jgi:polyvinyl alcohol dehydrogenase (cytochrome)
MDTATGKVLWSFASGGSVNSSPAIVGGVVHLGSGYHGGGGITSNNKFYAFQTH